jgi:hypothetical protein
MNVVIIVVAIALAAMLGAGLYLAGVGGFGRLQNINDGKSLIEFLDASAFNNLIDPREEKFLRENLPPPAFRSIQRLRLRAAIEYVMCANRNAAVLIRIGRSVSSEQNPERSSQAQELVNASVQLRLLSFFVLSLLCVKIAFPGLRLALSGVSNLHERLVQQMGTVTRIRVL